MNIETAKFVTCSNLFRGLESLQNELMENASFTWGDADRTLIHIDRMIGDIDSARFFDPDIIEEHRDKVAAAHPLDMEREALIERIRWMKELGVYYVDMEN
jgi:hypothetical protein